MSKTLQLAVALVYLIALGDMDFHNLTAWNELMLVLMAITIILRIVLWRKNNG